MGQSPEQRIKKLRDEINHHNYLYYSESRPQISDREFDRLLAELIELEKANPKLITPDSPSQRVGGDVQSELRPVRHAVPMMSIDNTYSEEEVRAFDERVRKGLGMEKRSGGGLFEGGKLAYVIEPKIDGASVSLRYEKGQLILAATRGRGNVGDDITVNARTIRSIPLSLRKDDSAAPPAILEVRGEVYMDNEDFQRVNKELVAEGEEAYANARNLTSGTLRRLDPKIVAKRRLGFLAHGLGQVDPLPTEGYWELTQLMRKWGLPVPREVWRVESIDEAIKCIHEFEKIRPRLPYMTDGVVLKVDSFEQREQLGATSKSPRWVIAYKYETEQQPTVLKDVRWQVGKGGKLTPVGDLEPVFISGVTVTHVTLHNIDQIHRLGVHYGDTVVVERAGEVIPYVVEVRPEKRPRGAKPVTAPTKCPECGTKVEREALPEEMGGYRCVNTECDAFYERKKVKRANLPEKCPVCEKKVEILDAGIDIYCPNPACPAQVKERLRWFCGRSQMDIGGMGKKIIDQLVDKGIVKTFGDIFRLEAERLANLVHETEIGEKTAAKIVESIREAEPKAQKMARSVLSRGGISPAALKNDIESLSEQLGITGLGDKTIEQLIETGLVTKPDDLFHLQKDQLAKLPREVRVGEKTAGKIIEAINEAKSRGLARLLAALGIPNIGTTVARNIAEWAGSIDTLSKATEIEIHRAIRASDREINDDEPASEGVIAKTLRGFLHSQEGKKTLDDLRSLGLKMTEARAAKTVSSAVSGKTVVITGGFSRFTRDQLRERLAKLGAKVVDSVSSKTDILLKGVDAGSKLSKALELGTVAIWDEEELMGKLPQIAQQ